MDGNKEVAHQDKPVFFTSIQVLRGVAALLVVLYHLVDAERIYGEGIAILDGIARFGFAGVDVFFVISGFVMMSIARDRFGSPHEARRFLVRRAIRILPLYWIYTTAIVALLLIPHAIDASYHTKSILASYLLWPQSTPPLLQVGWTLIYEAFFYLMMALAIAFVTRRSAKLYLLTWAIGLGIAQQFETNTAWLTVVGNPMGWEFIAGALVGSYWNCLSLKWANVALATGVMGSACAAAILNHFDLTDQDALRRTLVFGTCGVLVLVGLTRREAAGLAWPRGLWLLIGDASYSIYLSHLFVITLASRLWRVSGLNHSIIEHALFVLLALLACISVGIASYKLIEYPLLNMLERLVGCRRNNPSLARSPA